MSEMCARVNAFFNKDIFFVEVTKFIYLNVCVCVSYIHICLCVSISIYTYRYVFVSQFNTKCTLSSKSLYNHTREALFCEAKLNKVSS